MTFVKCSAFNAVKVLHCKTEALSAHILTRICIYTRPTTVALLLQKARDLENVYSCVRQIAKKVRARR